MKKVTILIFTMVLVSVSFIIGQNILYEVEGLEAILIENLELNEKKIQSKLSDNDFQKYKLKLVKEIIDSLQMKSKNEIAQQLEYLSFLSETDYRLENIDNPTYSINLFASPTLIEQAILTGCTIVQGRILKTIELKWKEILQEAEYLREYEIKELKFSPSQELQNHIKTIVKLIGNIESSTAIFQKTHINYNNHNEVINYLKKINESYQELRALQNKTRDYLELTREELQKNEKELKDNFIKNQ